MPVYALEDIEPEFPASGNYWVAPNAVLIGRVRLREDASVWWSAVLRGDIEPIEIGARSNVQDASVLHTEKGSALIIGDDVTIGHAAIVHGCKIGDGTLIGMGATVLSRAVIGRNCLVGAGALVPEDKTFPDNSLIVGAPARAIRVLDAESIQRMQGAAKRYVANYKRYAAGLQEL